MIATRFLQKFWGEDHRVAGDGDDDYYLLEDHDAENDIRIYGVSSDKCESDGTSVEDLINEWTKRFNIGDEDEKYFILHDKILHNDRPMFRYDVNNNIYGFQHFPRTDYIGRFLRKRSECSVKECDRIFQMIFDIIPVTELLKPKASHLNVEAPIVKRVKKLLGDDIPNEMSVEKCKNEITKIMWDIIDGNKALPR